MSTELKKTSITLSKLTTVLLERNKFVRDRSSRINQICGRYYGLITGELESVEHLLEDDFLKFVILEWVEVYGWGGGLDRLVTQVFNELKFDGDSVPDEAGVTKLVQELAELNTGQQLALVEAIEARAYPPAS